MVDTTTSRWNAVAVYDTPDGEWTFRWNFNEMSDLERLVERGPDFNQLREVTVTYAWKDLGK